MPELEAPQATFEELPSEAKPAVAEPQAKSEETQNLAPQFSDADAETLNRLTAMGMTPERASEVLGQNESFKQALYVLTTNPKKFFEELEPSNPQAFKRILEEVSDLYLKRNPPDEKTARATAESEVKTQLDKLQDEVNQFKTAQQRAANAQILAGTKQAYEQELGKMLKPVMDAMKLKPVEQKAVKALIDKSIGSDPNALLKINQRVFTDLPKHVKAVVDEWAGDKKTGAETDKAKREEVIAAAGREVASGPEQAGGRQAAADLWDETPFADALRKARK